MCPPLLGLAFAIFAFGGMYAVGFSHLCGFRAILRVLLEHAIAGLPALFTCAGFSRSDFHYFESERKSLSKGISLSSVHFFLLVSGLDFAIIG